MSSGGFEAIKVLFNIITTVFFREIKISGTHNIPKEGPCIFIVAPHANQFVDPGMVMISSPRQFAPLMAQSSFKMKVVGTGARLLNAIPVIRPQDLATKGKGELLVNKDNLTVLNGKDTLFTSQVGPRDQIVLSKTLSFEVQEVISDTELRLKRELTADAIELLSNTVAYKIIPHVDQHVLYEKVHERFNQGESIVIFPEGGSHDRPEMLPLKAGFAIMALGAMAENKGLDIKIVPVGLNYFHPHRFRSRAVVSYGSPISIESELVDGYKQGGVPKRNAIAKLLEVGHEALKSVTVNAPNYETLMIVSTARRLYKPVDEHKLTIDQVTELNRRFLLGYKYFENDPRLIELAKRIQAYNNTLKYFGLRDHQVQKTEYNSYSAAPILISRLFKLAVLTIFGFPSILLNSPLIILSAVISRKKQAKALAGSSVKIAARDVLATWKILVALVGIPTLYGFYSFLLFLNLYSREYQHAFSLSLLVWVLLPFIQYVCVLMLENSIDIYKSLHPLFMSLSNPDGAKDLRLMRENLSEIITKFVDENGSTALVDFDKHKFDHLELHEKVKTRKLSNEFVITPNILQKWLDDRSIFNFHSESDDDDEEDE